jgi:hypothetical protein
LVFAAFEWDHVVGSDYVRWVVIECAGIGELYGGIQALAPRTDIAYFLNHETAESDAKAFAEYKNRSEPVAPPDAELPPEKERLEAFLWDHRESRDLIRWAVLRHHPLKVGTKRIRHDVAYFLEDKTAELDSKWFAAHRNRALLERGP